MTIGEVLAQLRADFPELTISKIRYYERQGLLSPARSAAGYRKFSSADVSRLHYVLTAARDHYLPLKVIKERLRAAEGAANRTEHTPPGGRELLSAVSDVASMPVAVVPTAVASADGTAISPQAFSFDETERRLTRRELLRESGLDSEQLDELEAYGLVAARGASSSYDEDALTVARIVRELGEYGFQARHLRPVKAAVDREIGLMEQVLTALVRQSSREGRNRAEEHARGYAALSVRLHVALLESALRAALR
jgi:DNA-binding transcriptional MerR regulator